MFEKLVKDNLSKGDVQVETLRTRNRGYQHLFKYDIKKNINNFISPRIYKGSCIANFSEKEKTKKK